MNRSWMARLRLAMASLKALFEMPPLDVQCPPGSAQASVPATAGTLHNYYPGAPYPGPERLDQDDPNAPGESDEWLDCIRYEFDITFIVDTSPNIQLRDVYPSRWDAARTVILKYLARLAHKSAAARVTIRCTSMADTSLCPLVHVRDSHVIDQAMRTPPPATGHLWPGYMLCCLGVRHDRTYIVVLSDGHVPDHHHRQVALQCLRQMPGPLSFDCIGLAASPAQVDEEVLRTMASPGRDGRPRYRWVGQADELIHTFADLDLEEEC